MRRLSFATRLAALQAAWLLGTGSAPLVSMRAFEAVTGRKRDDWLVKTVALLALGFGAVLARDAARGRRDPVAGVAASLPFAVASGWYGGTGRISRVYLADAAVELAFAAAWVAVAARSGGGDRPLPLAGAATPTTGGG
jgi:hypothetical protein